MKKLDEDYYQLMGKANQIENAIKKSSDLRKRIDHLGEEIQKMETEVINGYTETFYRMFTIPQSLAEEVSDIEAQGLREVDNILMTETLHRALMKLWENEAIQKIFKLRATFKYSQLDDCCTYFLEELDRVLPPLRLEEQLYSDLYVPTLQDVLNCRKRTQGVVEGRFSIQTKTGEQIFRVVDVAGQRGARRKWIPFFSSCDAVLFVMSLAGYNQYLLEDADVIRLHEALNLFKEMVNQPALRKTPFIIFMNKSDLFKTELKSTSITKCFEDYRLPEAIQKGSSKHASHAAKFIKQKLHKQIDSNRGVETYFHITCATDTKQVNKIFSSITDIIISRGLASAGLM
mmetsp:Transcript_1073/g.1523  ORF Transcript_1073/g.1523 Transcript_1073/m.1523 type:complete len:345 (-) Transcript_1073:202-1236(-)